MTALKEVWRAQRQQRQQEAAQRQQQVSQSLAAVREERQTKAAQLRDDLSLFRESLTQNEKVRSQKVQQLQAELQQFRLNLYGETQAFLVAAGEQRQIQAQALAKELDSFVQALQQQTANFLNLTRADRQVMAQQLTRDLRSFHTGLVNTVLLLRQEIQLLQQQIQSQVEVLRGETQELLANNQHQRLQMQLQLVKDLAAFAENLRQEVQTYLLEMETMRQSRAQQLNQELTRNRINRLAEVRELFDRLATFRVQLQTFCANLKSSVWGEGSSIPTPPVPPTPSPKKPVSRALTVAPVVHPVVTAVAATPALPTPPVTVVPVVPVSVEQPVSILAKSGNGNGNGNGNSNGNQDLLDEKKVYNFLTQTHGARLTEIESSLRITRFQAVDALRSLIKKGMVTQRDRVYLIQEDLVNG